VARRTWVRRIRDERRLSDEQIATIRGWVAQGMPRGPESKMPQVPAFADGWQLGTPDLIVEMPEAFDVPAGGPDVYRNFVLPANLAEDKWVRAIEFRPGTRPVVHHALIGFIRAGSATGMSGKDGKPGFGGPMPVTFVPAFAPTGELDGWAVGQSPHSLPLGLAKRLPRESDLVVQLHLHPSGKPERERSKIGLYFASTPPTRRILEPTVPGLFGLQAGIDIPPGEKAFTISGTFQVGQDILLVSASAHTHYLGKEIKATATLPDGSTKPLLWIRNWDLNWQDRYYYKEPIPLPKGSRIDVTIVYDNSAENPHNPATRRGACNGGCSPPTKWGRAFPARAGAGECAAARTGVHRSRACRPAASGPERRREGRGEAVRRTAAALPRRSDDCGGLRAKVGNQTRSRATIEYQNARSDPAMSRTTAS
jgi:hypothetical protein